MRHMPHFSFLRSRQFLPIFIAQALGAFTDNFYRNAMAVFITFQLSQTLDMKAETLISMAAAVFILPFFLFSAIAGQIADRVAKHQLVRKLKAVECLLSAIAAFSLFMGNPWLMLFSLFLLGTQSAIFGPVKYAILPELLPREKLLQANALFEAGTFVAVLAGTLLGGLLVLQTHGLWTVAVIMILASIAGFFASLLIPQLPRPAVGAIVSWNIVRATGRVLRAARAPALLHPVLGISLFWALGAAYLTQFPIFAKQVFGGNEQVVTFLYALFSIAIAVGSWSSSAIFKGRGVKSSLVALAVFGCDLAYVISGLTAEGELIGVREFFQQPYAIRVVIDITLIAIAGGIFVVPLYTALQLYADAGERAQVIAANNVVNSLCITVTAVATAIAYGMGVVVQEVFLGVAALSVVAAGAVWLVRR